MKYPPRQPKRKLCELYVSSINEKYGIKNLFWPCAFIKNLISSHELLQCYFYQIVYLSIALFWIKWKYQYELMYNSLKINLQLQHFSFVRKIKFFDFPKLIEVKKINFQNINKYLFPLMQNVVCVYIYIYKFYFFYFFLQIPIQTKSIELSHFLQARQKICCLFRFASYF